jgi:hypothetical protein
MTEDAETGEARRIVRLKPSISAKHWRRLLAVADLPPEERVASWRSIAASLRAADRGATALGLVLADLCSQGWGMTPTDGELWVLPPAATPESGERAEAVKERLRGWLRVGRATQLADDAVRAFITKMETPRAHRGRRVSVLDLVDDGQALAASLCSRPKSDAPPSTLSSGLRSKSWSRARCARSPATR